MGLHESNWWGAESTSKTKAKMAPVYSGPGFGLLADTPVATPNGWVPAGALEMGEEVLTFDAGFQPLKAVVLEEVACEETRWPKSLMPIRLPAGVLDNRDEVLVMPHQGLLIELEDVADQWGDPYVVIPGAALDVLPGVERAVPRGAVDMVMPVFDVDHMVFAGGGLLMFCQAHLGARAGVMPSFDVKSNYNMLPVNAAKAMLEMMMDDFEGEAVA